MTLHATGASALRVCVRPVGSDAVSVRVYDHEGLPVASIDELVSRPMTAPVTTAGFLYEIDWVEIPTLAETSADFVVATLDLPTPGETAHAALRLVRDWTDARPLVIVVQDDLAGSAAWGLVRSAQSEQPGRFVLLDAVNPSSDTVAAAVATGEPQLRLRDGKLFAPRLTRVTTTPAVPDWNPDGTVLITGGTVDSAASSPATSSPSTASAACCCSAVAASTPRAQKTCGPS